MVQNIKSSSRHSSVGISQRSNELEVKAITTQANPIFYHTHEPWGVFTIGGTISNLYGAKIGVEKVGRARHGTRRKTQATLFCRNQAIA